MFPSSPTALLGNGAENGVAVGSYEVGSAYRIQAYLRSNARAVDRSLRLKIRYSVSDGPRSRCARLSVAHVGHISRQFQRTSSRSSKHANDRFDELTRERGQSLFIGIPPPRNYPKLMLAISVPAFGFNGVFMRKKYHCTSTSTMTKCRIGFVDCDLQFSYGHSS
jgi:hypothetical protein